MADKEKPDDSTYTEILSTEHKEDSSEGQLDSDTPFMDKDRRKSIIPSSHLPKSSIEKKSATIDFDNNENKELSDFDNFISSNFSRFSGDENISDWLDETEDKFTQHQISRDLRFTAIPMLIKGEAKRKYILIRNEIKSFDDFYEYLITNYDCSDSPQGTESLQPSRPVQSIGTGYKPYVHKNISFDPSNKASSIFFDDSDPLPPRPILRSTALADTGTTSFSGDEPSIRSTRISSRSLRTIPSTLDETTFVLRQAIVDHLIKSPKIFQGGKEDVRQWLEDLENLFDISQIPDGHKLDLIPYSLRGEALRWYKNNKSSLTSWDIFVRELKEAFLSPFHEELAFKKLESYTQGINQPIRSFYNEVLKLCSEADPTMSESAKLKNLLNKALPSLQFEIRRKRPTTTKQFLEFAKEIEELFQLSNISITSDNNNKFVSNDHVTSTITNNNTASSNTMSYSTPSRNQDKSQWSSPHPSQSVPSYPSNYQSVRPSHQYNSNSKPFRNNKNDFSDNYNKTKSPYNNRQNNNNRHY